MKFRFITPLVVAAGAAAAIIAAPAAMAADRATSPAVPRRVSSTASA